MQSPTNDAPKPGNPKNASQGRIRSTTGPAIPCTKGSLAARSSAPIINGK